MRKIPNVPSSLALIPDGNRRWAKKHRLSFRSAYKNGVEKFIDFSEWCMDYGIREVSAWAFSTENRMRPAKEVTALFDIYRIAANDNSIIEKLHKNRTRFRAIGDTSILPKDLTSMLKEVEKETEHYKDRKINMLVGYGGREDILQAARKMAVRAVAKGKVIVNERIFRGFLESAPVLDLDFIIRTSGEQRLSGFMPWQSCYAELYFSDKLWPEFSRADLEKALIEYNSRQRRSGL